MLTPFAFWQQPTGAVSSATQSLLYGIARYGSTNSAYSTSPTASTWTNSNIGVSANWYQMAYSETAKFFVIVPETTSVAIRRSSDLITWTASTLPTNASLRTVRWINDLGMYIVGGSAPTNLFLMTSTDGITFTTQSVPAVSGQLEDTFYGGGTAVSIAQQPRVITSNDGITWTERTAAVGNWHGGAYGNGIFVIGGLNGYMATSSNAINWNVFALTGSWRRIAYSPTLNLFVGTRYNSTIAYSSNGSSWTASNSGSAFWWDVIWVVEESRFVVTRFSSTQPVFTSTDGINWNVQSTILTSGTWLGITYRKQIT